MTGGWGVQGVANRDLKLENMLLDCDGSTGRRPMIKICDFGYSKVCLQHNSGCESLKCLLEA